MERESIHDGTLQSISPLREAAKEPQKPMTQDWGPRSRYNPQASPSFYKLLAKQSKGSRRNSFGGNFPKPTPHGLTRRASLPPVISSDLDLMPSSPARSPSPTRRDSLFRRASLTEGIPPRRPLPVVSTRRRGSKDFFSGNDDYTADLLTPSPSPPLRYGEVSPPVVPMPNGKTVRKQLSPVSPDDSKKAKDFVGAEDTSKREREIKARQEEYLARKERENMHAERFLRLYLGMEKQQQYLDMLADALKPPDICSQMVQMDTKDMIKRLRAAQL